MMLDVLNIGIMSADLIFAGLRSFPEPGKEIPCHDFIIKPGGSVNTAAAISALGLKATLIATVGRDVLGEYVVKYLREMGMDTSGFIQDTRFRTTVSAVLPADNDRGFATYFAETDQTAILKRIQEMMPSCRHVHTYMHDCLQYPICDLVKKHGRSLSVDTAWDESIRLEQLKPVMEQCDIFFTNEDESLNITGKSNALEALEELRRHTRLTVLKLGPRGSLVADGKTVLRIPAAKIDTVRDTTGAGDLYSAGFIYGHLNGWDLEKTARFASASGSLGVTFYGGVDKSYTLEKVRELYETLI